MGINHCACCAVASIDSKTYMFVYTRERLKDLCTHSGCDCDCDHTDTSDVCPVAFKKAMDRYDCGEEYAPWLCKLSDHLLDVHKGAGAWLDSKKAQCRGTTLNMGYRCEALRDYMEETAPKEASAPAAPRYVPSQTLVFGRWCLVT